MQRNTPVAIFFFMALTILGCQSLESGFSKMIGSKIDLSGIAAGAGAKLTIVN